MNICERKHLCWDYAVYVLFYGFYIWMAAQIPYTYDDWLWAAPGGIQDWLQGISNSRYVGNFFELLMCHSELMKTLIMGTGTFLVPWLVTDIATELTRSEDRSGKTICYVFSNLMVLTVNHYVWQQTYGWVAGFANFVLSGVFMLLCLRQLLPYLHDQQITCKRPVLRGIILFFLGMCGQLLAEHVSVLMAGLALVICVVSWIRTKSLRPQLLAMTGGMVLGLVIMFSSSFYSVLLTTGEALDGYRQLPVVSQDGFLNKVIYAIREAFVLFVWVWRNHWNVAVVILLFMSILVLRCKTHKYAWLRWPIVGLNTLLAVYFIANEIWAFVLPVVFVTAFDVVFFLAILGQFLFVFLPDRTRVCQLTALWLSAVVVMVPLAITSERRYRLYLAPHVLLLLICGILLCQLLTNKNQLLRRLAALACVVGTVVCLCRFGGVYYQIGKDRDLRNEIIAQTVESEAKTVVLPRYKNERYLFLQDPDPETGWGIDEFRMFYGLDPDVTIVIE